MALTEFKIYYKVTVITTMCHLQKNRQIDQWDITQSPEIRPVSIQSVYFDKGAKIGSSTNGGGTNGQSSCKKMNLDAGLNITHKISS